MTNLYSICICLLLLTACDKPVKKTADRSNAQESTSTALPETDSPVALPPENEDEEAAANQLIVPGKRINLLNLNEEAEVIHKILGEPTMSNAGMGKSMQTWKKQTADGKPWQLSVFFNRQMGTGDEKSRAQQIRLTAAAFPKEPEQKALELALKANRAEANKTAFYTQPVTNEQIAIYDNLKTGIAFELNPRGEIIAVTIHEPGKPAFEIFTEVSNSLRKLE